MKKLLVKNIGLLATPEGKSAHRGSEQYLPDQRLQYFRFVLLYGTE